MGVQVIGIKKIGIRNPVVGKSGAWTPLTPSVLKAVVATDTVINLSATNISSGETGLSWEISTDDITFTQKGTSTLGTFQATGLTAGTKYYFKVRQYKGTRFGTYSNRVYETTHPAFLDNGDGKTWGIYDGRDLTTITKDGSDRASAWNSKNGNGHNLLQAGADNLKPIHKYDRYLSFDDIRQFMKTAADVGLIQPITIYMVFRQPKNAIANNTILDGNAVNTGRLYQEANNKNIKVFAGTGTSHVDNFIGNEWDILRVVFHGATSKIQKNVETAVTGNFGAANMGGFTLGGQTSATYAAIDVKEIIIRMEDDATNYTAGYNYLLSRHFNKVFEKGMCSFTFDNGLLGVYERGFPLFASRGKKLTVYCNADTLDTGIDHNLYDTPAMTWLQAKEMFDAGQNIEDHGKTHIPWDQLTAGQLDAELIYTSAAFVSAGMTGPLHAGYPGNTQVTRIVVQETAKYRESGRNYQGAFLYTYKDTNKYDMRLKQLDKIIGLSGEIWTRATTAIDYCVANKTAVFFLMHDIAPEDESGIPESIRIDYLTAILDYAIASGIDVVSHKEIADLMDS